MRRADLFRRSSFRLVMTMTLFVVSALVIAGALGFWDLQSQLTARQDRRITEIFTTLEQTMATRDETDVVEEINSRIVASPDKSSVYLLKDQSGRVLASNIPDLDLAPGWLTVQAEVLAITSDYPYRIFTENAGRYVVSAGLSNADLDDMQEIIASSLGWVVLTVFVAAIGIGITLAVRMQLRLDRVNRSLLRVAQGDLTARLGLSGRGDDLDLIATSINGALERLERVVEAMRQVSTDIAHDLRTPLGRLRIRIEAAAEKAIPGQPIADDLALALVESDQINATFAALLSLAQIEAGARSARFRPVDLGGVLSDVADVYRGVAEDAGMVLGPFAAPTVTVVGDTELLTQMFANLIENAVRHCPKGTEITLSVAQTKHQAVATVADTGPGIPASERENVLRRLYRLEHSRTSDGSGLGLSLVKAIADLHHAAMTLQDTDPIAGNGLSVAIAFGRAESAEP